MDCSSSIVTNRFLLIILWMNHYRFVDVWSVNVFRYIHYSLIWKYIFFLGSILMKRINDFSALKKNFHLIFNFISQGKLDQLLTSKVTLVSFCNLVWSFIFWIHRIKIISYLTCQLFDNLRAWDHDITQS